MDGDMTPDVDRYLTVVGVNHESAPLDIREQLAVTPEVEATLPAQMRATLPIGECVFLNTCNRVELYVAGAQPVEMAVAVAALSEVAGADAAAVQAHAYSYTQRDCAHHLFRVASSLDSMVVGEAEVLGQVKAAYRTAAEAGATGKTLNALFQRAFNVAKEVRTRTAIGEGRVSVASVAVDFALRIFSSLADKTTLVIGAGEAAEGVLRALVDHGATALLVANRNYDRAVSLSKAYSGSAIRFDQLENHLGQADIVVGSSAAPHAVITADHVRAARRQRRNRTMLFLDISTPRDIEPAVGALDGVYLYNLDDLKDVADQQQDLRHQEVVAANAIIDRAVGEFMAQMDTLDLAPTIAAVRASWQSIRDEEVRHTLNRLNGVSDQDRAEIHAMADRLVNKLLHQPTVEVRNAATEPDGLHIVRAFRRLLHLPPPDRRA